MCWPGRRRSTFWSGEGSDIVYARVELLRHRLQYELGGDDVTNFRDTGAKAEYIRNMLIGDELQAAGIDPEIDVTWDAPSEVA